MSLLAFGSVHSSPGVTTLGLALSAVWPRGEVPVLVEASPDGGVLAALHQLGEDPGLTGFAAAARHGGRLNIWEHCQQLPGNAPVIVAPKAAGRVSSALHMSAEHIGNCLATLPGHDVLMDCGRLRPDSPTLPALRRASAVLLVLRPYLPELATAASALAGLQEICRPALILIGEGDYKPQEIERSLEVEIAGILPHDPRAADALLGRRPMRRLHRSSLLQAATSLSYNLLGRFAQQNLSIPGVVSHGGGLRTRAKSRANGHQASSPENDATSRAARRTPSAPSGGTPNRPTRQTAGTPTASPARARGSTAHETTPGPAQGPVQNPGQGPVRTPQSGTAPAAAPHTADHTAADLPFHGPDHGPDRHLPENTGNTPEPVSAPEQPPARKGLFRRRKDPADPRTDQAHENATKASASSGNSSTERENISSGTGTRTPSRTSTATKTPTRKPRGSNSKAGTATPAGKTPSGTGTAAKAATGTASGSGSENAGNTGTKAPDRAARKASAKTGGTAAGGGSAGTTTSTRATGIGRSGGGEQHDG